MSNYPKAKASDLVGTFPASVNASGGYVWDEVLEYRVWCHPYDGAPNIEEGNDYYYVFDTYEDALKFAEVSVGAELPVALVLQEEYIDEPKPEQFIHVKKQRLTEWPVEFLSRPRRKASTIVVFLLRMHLATE